MPVRAGERAKGVLVVRCLAGLAAILPCLVTGVGVAAAQASSTVQFQSAYRAYNLWDDWKSWLPDSCTYSQQIYGSEPAAPGRYPVMLYMHGTLADSGANVEGQGIVESAAAHGFLAAAFTYDSWVVSTPVAVDGNAKCMFSPGSNGNALAQVCARPKADCSRGVVVAGFSAGGAIAVRARNFAPQVRAAWVMGVNGPVIEEALAAPAGTRALPNERLRINVGRSDVEVRDPTTGQVSGIDLTALNKLTGLSCSTSPCLRSDGSGYFVVEHSEVADGVADHCYWLSVSPEIPSNSCTYTPTFDPGFRPPSTTPWSLITNLDWLQTELFTVDAQPETASETLPLPPADTTAPALQLRGATSSKVLRHGGVHVLVTAAEACTVTAKGRVVVRGSAKFFKLRSATKQVAKGRTATLKLTLKRDALRAIGRALKKGKRASAKVTVTAKDAAGNFTTKRRTIRLKR